MLLGKNYTSHTYPADPHIVIQAMVQHCYRNGKGPGKKEGENIKLY